MKTFSPPAIMGIVNVTPDSFSDGGQYVDVARAVAHATQLVAAGAGILDVGGESTRPGALPVSPDEELQRVVPVIEALMAAHLGVVLSVDTAKASVARAALRAGATMVNDVTALGDPAMASVVAEQDASLVLMHMRGEPRTMQQGEIVYDDVVREVCDALNEAAQRAQAAGVARSKILVDPGLGFGKTTQHNLLLTQHLSTLVSLSYPVVYGPSRKRFLGEITGRPTDDRDRATAAVCALAVAQGASVVRVHDVHAVRDAVLVAHAVRHA